MSELKERKTDGRLAEWIEVLEDSSGDGNDNTLLVLLLELRAFRRTRDKERERIAELEAELARRDEAAGEPVAWVTMQKEFCDDERTTITNKIEAEKYSAQCYDLTPLYTAPPAPSAPDFWVKCSERMPDDDTLCLGCDLDGVMWTLHFDEGQLMPDIGELSSAITHWMPLPAAPGGK